MGKSREVLKDFDAHLHDLRKYGFTFITALLATESLILPSRLIEPNAGDAADILPAETTFAALAVTLLLIIALQFIDRNYQIIQAAAAKRAIILEKKLNMELTNTISQRFKAHKVRGFVTLIYYAFVLAVVIIGGLALSFNSPLFLILLLVAGIASYAVHYTLEHTVKPPYPYGIIDWTLNPIKCYVGDEVEITLTSLDEKDHVFKKGTTMWQIREETQDVPLKTEIAKNDIELKSRDTRTWLWKAGTDVDENVKEFREGVYRLYRVTLNKKGEPNLPKLCKMIMLKIKKRPATSSANK